MLANDVLNPVGSIITALQPLAFNDRLHIQYVAHDELSSSNKHITVIISTRLSVSKVFRNRSRRHPWWQTT